MKYLFLLLLLLGITAKVTAQDMMLNGSFENCDGVAPPGTPYPYSIEYGSYWHNLTGTADLVHPCAPGAAGNPCFGIGCGRFGINGNGYVEYLYGQTLPLTAGQIYEVSFWIRKDYSTETLRKVGLAITEAVPTSAITSTTPLISEVISSTQCVKLKACFTAQNNVTHYVTIGPFGGGASPEPILYLVDSVSVMTIPPTTPLAESNVTASETVLCAGDQITLNGTTSANETSYEWNIYTTNSGNNLVYSSGVLLGTAGTLTPLLPFAIPGNCYRAELTVYGVCKDVSTVEFCIANPNIDFIFDGNPVCENTPVDLVVTGDNGWIYTWSNGNDTLASGTGSAYQALTVTPTIGNGIYTVTVTTPEGCTHSESLHLNVNSQNNIAPWMDGINGTGEYTYYVSQGDAVFFNSMLSNDNLNENMLITPNPSGLPSGYVYNLPSQTGGIFSFSWVTTLATSPGEYHFLLTVNDRNACIAGIDTFDFRIIVVCDQCLVCVGFEDRTPASIPLPPETKAGKCIEAGLSQVVSTGDANVLFQAGVSITEGPYFDAGPGYEAIIDPTTCVTDCEDCCADWNGFHFDEHAYYSYMNHSNNDPTDDYFEITDVSHPFCAYGAKYFEMHFMDSDTQETYHSVYGGATFECCQLESTAPENPIPHSSIFWNGTVEAATGGWADAPNQVYIVQLILHGCNGETEEHYFMLSKTFYGGMVQNNADTLSQIGNNVILTDSRETILLSNPKDSVYEALEIYPNPATNMLYISGNKTEITIQIYDEKGRVLTKREKVLLNQGYNLEPFSAGKYYCRIYREDGTYVLKHFIKL